MEIAEQSALLLRNSAYWPIKPDGPLPKTLFSDEHLHEMFLCVLPAPFKLSARDVRQALKSLIKSEAPALWDKSPSDEEVRAKWMVSTVCNHSSLRSELPRTGLFQLRRRLRNQLRRSAHATDLSNILWRAYVRSPPMKSMVDRLDPLLVEDHRLSEGVHLTLKVVSRPDFMQVMGADLATIDFARTAVIFSALLPHEEKLEVLGTLHANGCQPLDCLLVAPDEERLAPQDYSRSPQVVEHTDAPILEETPPVLRQSRSAPTEVGGAATLLIAALQAAENEERAKTSSLEAMVAQTSTLELVTAPQARVDAFVSLLDAARRCHEDAENARSQLEKAIDGWLEEIGASSGYAIHLRNTGNKDSSQVIQRAEIIDSLRDRVAEQSFPHSLREKYRGSSSRGFTLEELNQLRHQIVYHWDWLDNSVQYLHALTEYWKRRGADREPDLESRSAIELAALATACQAPEWGLVCAILIRAALDGDKQQSSAAIAAMLCESQSTDHRRTLLYFLSPDHVASLKGAHAKRIAALEYIRDALEFGPVATLSEPHSWLREASIVGRNCADLVELLVTNSDRLENISSVSRLLRPEGEKYAERAYSAYVKAPIGMQGHFRRLREMARDAYFAPVLESGTPQPAVIEGLVRRLESEGAAQKLFDELASHRPGELGSRHIEQLQRYISRGCTLLRDLAAELAGVRDERENSLRAALVRIHGKLARSGEAGGLSWFEAQLRQLLSGTAASPIFPTLQAGETPFLTSIWSAAHNDWAVQSLDLPTLHLSNSATVQDVAIDALCCRRLDVKPTKENIVEALASKGDLKAALTYARSDSTESLEDLVREIAAPETLELKGRMDRLRSLFGTSAVEASPEAIAFESHLHRLDLEQAADALELLELALNENSERTRKSEEERIESDELSRKIRASGASIGPGFDIAGLRRQWEKLLLEHESERSHLEALIPTLSLIETRLPELSKVIDGFKKLRLEPRYWLTASAAADFAYVLGECASRIGRWAESASLLKQEERRALSVLAEWFVQYVLERVDGLQSSGDIPSALGLVMEASDCITSADSPVASLKQLREVGEFNSSSGWLEDVRETERKNSSSIVTESGGLIRGLATMPSVIADVIIKEEWSRAIELCLDWKDRLQPEDSDALRATAEACKVLSGAEKGATADALDAAVTLLTSTLGGVGEFSPARKVFLAQRVLAAAFIAEGSEDIQSLPQDLSWPQLVALRNSPLRRTASADGVAVRIVNELLVGLANEGIAQAIWDGASRSSDPAQARAALLSRLYDLDLTDSIYKMASRQEPGLAQRLNQLFELRNVASTRPDLVPVGVSLAENMAASTRSAPFKSFLKALPIASSPFQPELQVRVEGDLVLGSARERRTQIDLTIIVSPSGLAPERLEASLVADDDVTFAEGGIRRELSLRPIYVPTEYNVGLQFGASWGSTRLAERGAIRIRVRARTLTGEIYSADAEVQVRLQARPSESVGSLVDETLLDAYPGVSNTPAIDAAFYGRFDELETLHKLLISSRRPSPVLLIGLRRIGKTSLMFALHRRHRTLASPGAVTFYLSLAERRVELSGARLSVSAVVFNAIVHGLARQNLNANDQNHDLCGRIREQFGNDIRAARDELMNCFDHESLADSLSALREKVGSWIGDPEFRLVILIDEAEALVAAYNCGGTKRLELEQFLQSVRELSQRDEYLAFLLAGSNHINVFAREYKNAFFGSSQIMELGGLERASAPNLVSPQRIAPFVRFDQSAVDYAFNVCAGMPQFLWQIGATTSHLVRSGVASRNDIRRAVGVLTSHEAAALPFKSYEILEPIDSVLGLEHDRERDLLWMLLYRVAQSSSLIVEDAATAFVIDQALMQIDDRDAWKRRIAKLAELGILKIPSPNTVAFLVPIFAEGFRSAKNWQEYNIRQQKVTR